MLVTKEALACSSRVSLGSLFSLSHPGSHKEISLVTILDLSDTSGVTRCTQSVYLNGTTGSDSFLRRTETATTTILRSNDVVSKLRRHSRNFLLHSGRLGRSQEGGCELGRGHCEMDIEMSAESRLLKVFLRQL